MSSFFSIICLFCLVACPSSSARAASPALIELSRACGFAILGPSIANSGASSVTGDIGSPAQSGFGTLTLVGTNYFNGPPTSAALSDLQLAYNDGSTRGTDFTVGTELGGTTLTQGVYHTASGTFGLTGVLTIDAGGNTAAVFIFKADTTLVTAASSAVLLTQGAQAQNVFWVLGSSATLGASSQLSGSILASNTITFGAGATLMGRALALASGVSLDGNTVTELGPCAMPTPTPAAAGIGPAWRLRTDHNSFDPRRRGLLLSGNVDQAGHLELRIFDLAGRPVRALLSQDRNAGPWTAVWDGRTDHGDWAASDVYLILLTQGQDHQMAKVALLRD